MQDKSLLPRRAAGKFTMLMMAAFVSLMTASEAHAQSASSISGKISQLLFPTAVKGPGVRNGLPPTRTDSFVYEAKENAEFIYGDEGIEGPPPYLLFTKDHRVNSGIYDRRDAGLTTGHGSYLPDAVGRDEFNGQEWDQSGARGWNQKLALLAADPYKTPGVVANSTQFPTGYQILDWTNGQIDETRWGTPLPLLWNAQNAGTPGAEFWTPLPNGQWANQYGVILDREGTATWTKDVQYKDGSYQGFAGDVRYRDGRFASWVVPPNDSRRNLNHNFGGPL
jgi:hypothetical protein